MKQILKNKDIKYSIIDTESLKGLWTLQVRSENMDKAIMFECYNDADVIKLYKMLSKSKRALYNFSINYDKTMLNGLCKFVEKECTDIVNKLRRLNDYIIMGNINYFKLNREFWCDIYFNYESQYEDKRELFQKSIELMKLKYNNDKYINLFLDEFPYLLGQSKVYKRLNVIDIPKMLYYFSIRKDGIIRPSISLKNIQLFEEGYNIVHDFEQIFDLEKLKEEGLLEDFRKYSLNDVDFLFRYFEKKCLPVINQRYHACKAIQRFKSDFEYTDRMIHSENNTNLLVNAFSLPEQDKSLFGEDFISKLDELTEVFDGSYKYEGGQFIPNGEKEFITQFNTTIEEYKIDNPKIESIYDNIKSTGYKEFDELVEFVKENNDIKKDKMIKEMYCEQYDLKYNKDDEYCKEHEGKVQVVVDKFNEFDLFGTKVVVGLGGIHGAIENYIKTKLYHLDYRSLYPSIILQFKQYYKTIINIELYEALYNFRNFEVKPKIAQLEKEREEIINLIDASGNDGATIAENGPRLDEIDIEIKELDNLSNGAKLLLNSLYGLINSEFNFSISNKILGRFICLYGQFKAIELCKRVNKHCKITNNVNVNTDGLILDNIDEITVSKIVEEDKDGYLVLGVTKIDRLIQIDVNNYIKIVNDKMKTKGSAFSTGMKHAFHRFEKLTCNIQNALNLIENKAKVEILPILFHQKSKKASTISLEGEESSKNKVYYLTNKEKGKIAIKHIANPIILSWGGRIMYFTTNKDEADMREYIKFARITEEKILTFTLTEKDNFPYIAVKLVPEANEELNKLKQKVRVELNKIAPGLVCFNGFEGNIGNILTVDKKPIKELSNYTMTAIKNSTEVLGVSIKTIDMICVTTSDKEDQEKLDNFNTFAVNHVSGMKMYIFNKNDDFSKEGYNNIKVLNNEFVPVWTLDNKFTYVPNQIKEYAILK